jgi:predicted transcriptional regulator
MKKRSRLEMNFEVLKVIKSGVDKLTLIMYRTNLSWRALSDILERLVEHGFVELKLNGKRNRYYISDKGRESLSYYEKSKEDLNAIEANGEG